MHLRVVWNNKKTRFVSDTSGGKVDVHKFIGKLPKPERGLMPPEKLLKPFGEHYRYMGTYNPLDKQLKYDKKTCKIIEFYEKPLDAVDVIAAHRDVCYDIGKYKGDCDREMVKSLDKSRTS